MAELPQDLDEAIAQSRTATQAALDDGHSRLQVELVFPEIDLQAISIAELFAADFEARYGDRFKILFPDAGAAALAKHRWGEKPYEIRGISELKAQIQPDEQAFLMIAPSSVEVGPVEKFCEEAGDRPVVMVNPRLEDVATIGIGYAGRQLRERFLSTLLSCYYLRPFEGGALRRCYPGPWEVWLETETGYEKVAEESQKPVGDALDQIIGRVQGIETNGTPAPGPTKRKGFLSGLQEFLRALSQ